MQNVRLIIFAGCNTADNGDDNLAHRAYYLGAKTSIVWSPNYNSSKSY